MSEPDQAAERSEPPVNGHHPRVPLRRTLALAGVLAVTALLVLLTVAGTLRGQDPAAVSGDSLIAATGGENRSLGDAVATAAPPAPGAARSTTPTDGIQPPPTSGGEDTRAAPVTPPRTSTADAPAPRGSAPQSATASAAHAQATDLEREDRGNLLAVVTKRAPIDPLDYAPNDLVNWRGSDYQVREEVAAQLERLFTAAEADGVGFRVISGYRSYETQAGTYDYWLRQSGRAAADATSARPGHSEHQTGLAVDLDNLTGECYLAQCFGETDDGRWLAARAHEFGFLISYPEGTREVTGFAYEPWHLRYVGPQVAGDMEQRGIRLLSSYLGASASSARLGERVGSLG